MRVPQVVGLDRRRGARVAREARAHAQRRSADAERYGFPAARSSRKRRTARRRRSIRARPSASRSARGAAPAAVPDVGGKSPADAGAALQARRLHHRACSTSSTPTQRGRQRLRARSGRPDATAPRHSTVTISVAVPGTVPDVTNMTLDDAKARSTANGYAVGNGCRRRKTVLPGKVARTDPEANASCARAKR